MGEPLLQSATRGPLRAGAARVDITPEDLTGLTNLWRRSFAGVHDPIFVRALVVDNGINSAAIVADASYDIPTFESTNTPLERRPCPRPGGYDEPPRPVIRHCAHLAAISPQLAHEEAR